MVNALLDIEQSRVGILVYKYPRVFTETDAGFWTLLEREDEIGPQVSSIQ